MKSYEKRVEEMRKPNIAVLANGQDLPSNYYKAGNHWGYNQALTDILPIIADEIAKAEERVRPYCPDGSIRIMITMNNKDEKKDVSKIITVLEAELTKGMSIFAESERASLQIYQALTPPTNKT